MYPPFETLTIFPLVAVLTCQVFVLSDNMPRLRRCWVPKCKNNNVGRAKFTRLFTFPRDVERCLRWLKTIGDESLAFCPWKVLVSQRFVCIEHFMPHMISATNRALCNALPLLFTNVRPELPDAAIRAFLDTVPASRCPSPSDGATVFKDLFANHDSLHPQNQDLPEFQQHSPFADTCEDSNEFNPFGDQIYPKDQDTPGLQEHSPVADTHEDSEEFKLFVDPPYPKNQDTPYLQEHSPVADTYEDSEEFKLFVDSAIIDHDYLATSVPSDLQVAGCTNTYQNLNNNQEDLSSTQRKLETLRRELCRLCGQRGSVLTPLFDTTLDPTMDESLSSKIDMYLPIKVKLDDALPLCICSNCLTVLNQWHELYTTCVAADGVLLKTFGTESHMTNVNNPCLSPSHQNAETQTEEVPSGALTDKTQTNAPKDVLGATIVLFTCCTVKQTAETQSEEMPADALTDGIKTNAVIDDTKTNAVIDDTETNPVIDEIKTNAITDAAQTNSLTEETSTGDLRAETQTVEMPSDSLTDETRENYIYSHLGISETGTLQKDKLSLFEFDSNFQKKRNNLHKCRFCSDIFADTADYRSHIAMCRQLSTICELCGLKVPCRKKLKKHKYQKHNATAPQKYLCDKCDKFFKNISRLRLHHSKIHGPEDRSEKYCCELCGSLFTREIYYETHKRKHEMGKVKTLFHIENFRQEVNSEGLENGVVYVCPVCQEKFNDMHSLAFHLTEKKKLKCSSCRKVKYSEKSIFLHVCGQWTCQYCSKTFDQRVKWLIHERGHTGEKPVKCRKCDKTFRKWQTRNVHEARHEPMSHLCTYCGKRFRNKRVFQDHVSCHEGKEFLCHICNKKFSGRRTLNKHLSTFHKGLKNVVCSNV